MGNSIKRRNYFIKKDFQGKYIFNAFLLVVLGSILFGLMLSFFSSNTLSIVYDNYHLQLGTTPGILLDRILNTQWLFVVLGGLTVVVLSLFLTHRIAGPFFRFEKTLDSMTDKDLTRAIHLRTKDEGKELAGKINDFNRQLSFDLSRIKYNARDISRCCSNIKAGEKNGTEDPEGPGSNLEQLEALNSKILEILDQYTLMDDR